jgi:orotidine-5'-phosphate decarboxylase
MKTETYEARAKKHQSEIARTLLELIATKKTNLCVSVDLTSKAALLKVVDLVGPYVCLIKVGLTSSLVR